MEEDQERTTSEIIITLGQDCERCHRELVAVIDAGQKNPDGILATDYEYYARQLIRSIFAYIEAVTYSVKAWSAHCCIENDIEITPQERYFAADVEYELDAKGEVVETAAKVSLARNIRFAILMNCKAHCVTQSFDASVEWWSCLMQAIKVRDRLTHPKRPGDLDITSEDILNALKAKKGFEQEILNVIKA